LIFAAMAYDWRTRGRVIVALQFLRAPLSTTSWWYAIADFLARFSG
jgi:hypothetical protein